MGFIGNLVDAVTLMDSNFLDELLSRPPRNDAESKLHAAVMQARANINDPSSPDFTLAPPPRAMTRGAPFSVSVTIGTSSVAAVDVNRTGYGFQIIPSTVAGSGSLSANVPPALLYPLQVNVTSLEDGRIETLYVVDSGYFDVPYGFSKLTISSLAPETTHQSLLAGASGTFYVNIVPDPGHGFIPGASGRNFANDFPAAQGGAGTQYLTNGELSQTANASNAPSGNPSGVSGSILLDGVSYVRATMRPQTGGATFAGGGNAVWWYYNAAVAKWYRETTTLVAMTSSNGQGSLALPEKQVTVRNANDALFLEASSVTVSAGTLVAVNLIAVRY